jgi:hypothetical protein
VFMSSGAAGFGCPAHLNLSTPPYLPTLRRLEAGALRTICYFTKNRPLHVAERGGDKQRNGFPRGAHVSVWSQTQRIGNALLVSRASGVCGKWISTTHQLTTKSTGLAASSKFAMRLSSEASANPCWRARWSK